MCWFAVNLLHAGNRMALATQAEQFSSLQEALRQAQTSVPTELTDDEIIAALADETKRQMVAQGNELFAARTGTGWFSANSNGQMKQYQLVEVRHVPNASGRGAQVLSMLELTQTGARVLQRLVEMKEQGKI